jgi:hypothetical protein
LDIDSARQVLQSMLELPDHGELSEDARGMAGATIEIILTDMANLIAKQISKTGPGIPVVGRDRHVLWHTPTDLIRLIDVAVSNGDIALSGFFRALLDALANMDPEEYVLIAFADASGVRVNRLPRADPGALAREVLDSW